MPHNSITNFRISYSKPDRIRIRVNYTLDVFSPRRQVFIGAEVLRGGKRIFHFGVTSYSATRRSGTATIEIIFGYNNAPMYVSTSAINIKMYSKGRSVLFYSKTFGYYKNWRRVDTSQRVYPRLKHIFPRVPVYLDWDVPRISDHSVQDIKDVLNGMNDLLFDACDGQIRIGKFVLYDKSRKPRTAARGSIHFHVSGAHGGMGMATLGDPAKPGKIHLGRDLIDSHGGPEPHAHYSYTALMEFCHAYFKMLDEYNPGGKGRCADNDQFACPLDHNVGGRRRPNPDMTEFCGPDSWGRPYAHFRGGNPKNDMESRYHMGCYEWLKKIMWDKKKKNIEIPTSPLQGPKSAPKPVWEYRI